MHCMQRVCIRVCMKTRVRERTRNCGTTKRVRETLPPSLCARLRQTLCAFLCCIRRISSFWSTSPEISSGKWRAWICLPGTRWDCVITVGSWSFFWDSECKDIGVSILSPGSWKQTSNITVGKQDDVCFDYSVSQKSAPLCNISQYFVQTEKTFILCVIRLLSIFFQVCPYFVIYEMEMECFRIKHENKILFLLHHWTRVFCRMINLCDLCAVNNLWWFMKLPLCFWIHTSDALPYYIWCSNRD